jgi:hypothetical protein
MGLSLLFRSYPTPGLDIADNGLAARIDADMLHPDCLLAFAAVLIQRIQERGKAS